MGKVGCEVVRYCTCVAARGPSEGEKVLSPTIGVPGIELGSAGLAASVFSG